MTHPDPLINDLEILFRRLVIFISLTLCQAVLIWIWFWVHYKNWTIAHSLRNLSNVWPLSIEVLPSAVGITILWITASNSSIAFFVLGRWWNRRSNVFHRRGGRFVDERER